MRTRITPQRPIAATARRGALCLALAVTGCELVSPHNPYDPETPLSAQAPASLRVEIALVDETLDDPSAQLAAWLNATTLRLSLQGGESAPAYLRNADGSIREGVAREVVVEGRSARASFALDGLVPGEYGIELINVPSHFRERPALPTVTLSPGEAASRGPYVFRYRPDAESCGPGEIAGEVRLDGESLGTVDRQVGLYRLGGDTSTLVDTQQIQGTSFHFRCLLVGRYAVVASSAGYTPAFALDVNVGLPPLDDESGAVGSLSHALSGGAALTLYPVTAVLLPQTNAVEGQFYTRLDELPVAVLAFGGVSQMQLAAVAAGEPSPLLSVDDRAAADAGAPPASEALFRFHPYAASTEVALPPVEGRIRVDARFAVESVGGQVFFSPIFSTEVVRDVTPPSNVTLQVPTSLLADDGTRYLRNASDGIDAVLEAADAVSAIAGFSLSHGDEGPPQGDGDGDGDGDGAFVDITSSGGVARYVARAVLAPGDGARVLVARARDRAGNVSAPASLTLHVDDTPPRVDALVIGDGSGVVRRADPLVQLDVFEAGSGLAAYQLSADGTFDGPRIPYVSSFPFPLASPETDGDKEVHIRVFDRAGNDTTLSGQVALLTRGALTGTARLDDAAALGVDHAGIEVTVFGNGDAVQAVTDAAGGFRVPGLKEGFYNLQASRSGYQEVRENGLFVLGGVDNAVGNLTLARVKGRVVGTVEAEGRSSAIGAEVRVLGTGYTAQVDAVGSYELLLPVGNYDGLSVSLPYFDDVTFAETLTVTEAGAFTVPSLSLVGASGKLTGYARLSGEADTAHGGILVTLSGQLGSRAYGVELSTSTDATGFFAFDDLGSFDVDDPGPYPMTGSPFSFLGIPVGTWQLTLTPPLDELSAGREIGSQRVVVSPGSETRVDAELRTLYLVINDGDDATRDPNVTLTLGATDCFHMRLFADTPPSDVPDLSDPSWLPCKSPTSFDLGGTQGDRTVYGQFVTSAGIVLPIVGDEIYLDSEVRIESFTHNAPSDRKLGLGERITFVAVTGEPGGSARVKLTGYDDDIALPEGGEACAGLGAGCYSRVYDLIRRNDVQPSSSSATSGPGVVELTFTDPFGNVGTKKASTTVAVGIPPIISGVEVIPNLFDESAEVRFATDELATGVIRHGPGELDLCQSDCPTTPTGKSHSGVIAGLSRSTPYYARVEATDAYGNTAVTPLREFFLRPDPPQRVVAMPGDGRVFVRWEAPPQLDVVGYRIERREEGGASWENVSGAEPFTHEALLFDDDSIVNGQTYRYRVVALDGYGNESEPADTLAMAGADPDALASFSGCADVTPSAIDAGGAGTDVDGGVLPRCSVWTEHGSPYRVNGSVAVRDDGILLIGPNVEVRVAADVQIVVRGRIGVYGDRGAYFEVPNQLPGDWGVGPITNGVPREEPTGQVRFVPDVAGTTWRGFLVRNQAVFGPGSGHHGGHRQGDLWYRFVVEGCAAACFDTDAWISLMRGELPEGGVATSYVVGQPAMMKGMYLGWALGQSGTKMVVVDSDAQHASINTVNTGVQGYLQGLITGSFSGRHRLKSELMVRLADSLINALVVNNFQSANIFGLRARMVLEPIPYTASNYSILNYTAYASHVFRRGEDNPRRNESFYGSEVFGLSVTDFQGNLRASQVFGILPLTVPSSPTVVEISTLATASCSSSGSILASYAFGTTYAPTGLTSDCLDRDEDNFDRIHDYYDDVTLGEIRFDDTTIGSYPRPEVHGPILIQRSALGRGIVLRASGTDLDDGPLPADAAYWTDAAGVVVGDGPWLQLPRDLAARATPYTYYAHAVDSDGQDSDIPWPVEVIEDAAYAEDFIWPDEGRWRSAVLRFDELPPKAGATDVATFRWRCSAEPCETTCAIDGAAPRLCRSPVEVAGLSPGGHTFEVQMVDASGAAVDLPQRYAWDVSEFGHMLNSQPAGSSKSNGAWLGQGVASVGGRNAWRQRSDWNRLDIPAEATTASSRVELFVPGGSQRTFYLSFLDASGDTLVSVGSTAASGLRVTERGADFGETPADSFPRDQWFALELRQEPDETTLLVDGQVVLRGPPMAEFDVKTARLGASTLYADQIPADIAWSNLSFGWRRRQRPSLALERESANDTYRIVGDVESGPEAVSVCAVEGLLEKPCGATWSVPATLRFGSPAREIVIRRRDRETALETLPTRYRRLNDPEDLDGDGWLDAEDPCLSGAEVAEWCDDDDRDTVKNDQDNCPGIQATDTTDTDGDGVGDVCDNCPTVSSLNFADGDGDGVGDVCDVCPTVADDQTDTDNDGVGDVCDN